MTQPGFFVAMIVGHLGVLAYVLITPPSWWHTVGAFSSGVGVTCAVAAWRRQRRLLHYLGRIDHAHAQGQAVVDERRVEGGVDGYRGGWPPVHGVPLPPPPPPDQSIRGG